MSLFVDSPIRFNCAAEVRLIDADGKQVGVVPITQAQDLAREKDLDLVEISPTANPPVCKIMDYGKYIFQQKKKQSEAKKKQKVIGVKEVQFRPRIDEHDFDFKKNKSVSDIKGPYRGATVRVGPHVQRGRGACQAIAKECEGPTAL